MRNILLLGHHDIRMFLRDRAAYVWLLVMPLVFVWMMSFAARGPTGPDDARPRILVDNRDGGFMGRVFLRVLGDQGVEITTPAAKGDARRGIVLPADFTARVLDHQQAKLEFFVIEGSDSGMAEIVRLRLWRALVAVNAHLARAAIDHPGAPLTEEVLETQLAKPAAVSLEASHAGRKPRPVGFSFSLPGNLVAYLFLNTLIIGGSSVAEQRRIGVMRRLAVNPITRLELLFGKLYGLVLLSLVQTTVLLLAGRLLFGVNIGANLPGILATLVVFGWVAASCGVLIGLLVEAHDKIIGLCLAVALPAAALGGCWWPLELAPPIFRTLAHAVPAGWALDALHQLITFGAGFEQVLAPIGVLVLFGAAANAAAIRFFRV